MVSKISLKTASAYCELIYELYFASFCFREAISAVCERRGVDVDSINVYLEQSRTPLPLLTTETAWLGGRHIRIRGKKTVTLITHSVSKCTWMYTYALSITAILQYMGLELMRLFRNMSLLCLPIKIVWQCEIR